MSLVEHELIILPEHLNSPTVFSGIRVMRSLVLCVCFVDRCLSYCPFFLWPLCYLFFFDIRILVSPLVSSNSSFYAPDEGYLWNASCVMNKVFLLLTILTNLLLLSYKLTKTITMKRDLRFYLSFQRLKLFFTIFCHIVGIFRNKQQHYL